MSHQFAAPARCWAPFWVNGQYYMDPMMNWPYHCTSARQNYTSKLYLELARCCWATVSLSVKWYSYFTSYQLCFPTIHLRGVMGKTLSVCRTLSGRCAMHDLIQYLLDIGIRGLSYGDIQVLLCYHYRVMSCQTQCVWLFSFIVLGALKDVKS